METLHNEGNNFIRRIGSFISNEDVKIILDVGSRDAKESIFLKRYFPNAKVYAFECNPEAVQLCKKNIGDNKDIFLVEKAVSDVDGIIDFYSIDPEKTITPHSDGNIGASSLYIANPEYPYEKYVQTKIQVESITLKKWLLDNNIAEIDIIWIDLQGAELRAFKGMNERINNVRIIHTEVEFKEMYFGQSLFWDIDLYLKSKGFCLFDIDYHKWCGNAIYIQKSYALELTKPIVLKYKETLTRIKFFFYHLIFMTINYIKKTKK